MDDDLYEAVLVQAKRRRALLANSGLDPETLEALVGVAAMRARGPQQPAVIEPATTDEIVGFFA